MRVAFGIRPVAARQQQRRATDELQQYLQLVDEDLQIDGRLRQRPGGYQAVDDEQVAF